MGPGRRTLIFAFTVIGGVLLAVLVLGAHWPLWTWPVLASVLLAAPVLSVKPPGPRPNPVLKDLAEYLPMTPVERREQRVIQVLLPSSRDDYNFLFSAMVRWCTTGVAGDEHIVNPGGLAIDTVLRRARTLTEHRPPESVSLVQYELNGMLGRMQPDSTGYLQVMAESVALTLSDHDQERLDKLAAVRKDEAVWQHERKYEQSKREYLGDDVLKDTGSAVVWWLARNDDHVEKTVRDIGLLAQLSSAANNQDVPERFHRLVPGLAPARPTDLPYMDEGEEIRSSPENGMSPGDHFGAFLRTMDFAEGDPERALLARRVAGLVTKHGRHEAADELVRRFDAPDIPGSDHSDPSGGPGDQPDVEPDS